MKNRHYYIVQDIRDRKVIFCIKLSIEDKNLVTKVGMSVTNPTDEYNEEKGKMIAKNRCKTICKGHTERLKSGITSYSQRVRKPYIYSESIEYPCWKGINFQKHVDRITELVTDRIKKEPHLYIKALTPKVNKINKVNLV